MLAAIGGGVSAGISLGSMIASAIKKRKANMALNSLKKPIYERPDEFTQLGDMAAMRLLNPELPGQSILENNIAASTANAIKATQDFGGVQDIYTLVAQENKAKNDMSIQAAQQRIENENQFYKILEMAAQYSNQEFDYNVNLPYQEKRQRLLQQAEAGSQGVATGLNTLASLGASMMNFGFGDSKNGFDVSTIMGTDNQQTNNQ